MSRSEKKTPIVKNDKFGNKTKRLLNKKIRKIDLGNNSNYKKIVHKYGLYDDRYKSNLYQYRKIDGIPFYRWLKRRLTINEIMEYWRK
jgi:hypothetical protein